MQENLTWGYKSGLSMWALLSVRPRTVWCWKICSSLQSSVYTITFLQLSDTVFLLHGEADQGTWCQVLCYESNLQFMRKIDDISNARVPELALRFYVSYISRAQKSNLCRVAYLLSRLERKLLSRCMIIYRFSKYRVIEFIFNKLIIGNIAFIHT